MSRLIDADDLIENIKIWEIGTSIDSDQKEFINFINTQPTKYDVDHVAELLTNKFRIVSNDKDLEWNRAIDSVIKIIRKGLIYD